MSGTVVGDQSVDAVGRPVGIYLRTQGIYVAGLKEIQTVSGEKVSPCAYILQEGDYITVGMEKNFQTRRTCRRR